MKSISGESSHTATRVAAWHVRAFSEPTAFVHLQLTFVDVCNTQETTAGVSSAGYVS